MKKILLLALAITGFSAHAQFWTPKSTGFATTSRGVDDITIVDDNVIWAKAYDGSGAGLETVKEFTKSLDGGNTWTPGNINVGAGTGSATLGIGGLTAVSATHAWVAAFPTAASLGGIWKTENGGTTWTKQLTALFNSATSFANLVYFWNLNDGFCQGDPAGGYFELYTTNNGGTNWTRVPQANIPAPLTDEYGYVHNYEKVGNTIWFGTNKGRLYKSIDKGLNWTVSQTPATDFAGAAASARYSFSDHNRGILNTSAGLLYTTTDGGATWTQLPPTGVTFSDIAYVPGTATVVANGSADLGFGSFFSYDNGISWTTGAEEQQYTVLAVLNANTAFAGGFTTSPTAGGIFKYTGNQLKTATFDATTLKVYPNPADNMLIIASENAISSVEIYNLLGKQVFSQTFSSVNQATLDVSNLALGGYIVKTSSDSGEVQTTKLMKK